MTDRERLAAQRAYRWRIRSAELAHTAPASTHGYWRAIANEIDDFDAFRLAQLETEKLQAVKTWKPFARFRRGWKWKRAGKPTRHREPLPRLLPE